MKPTDGRYQTATQVKVSSPEINEVWKVDGVQKPEDRTMYFGKVRDMSLPRGRSPWYGIAWKLQELGRAWLFLGDVWIIANNPERRGCNDDNQAVGLTHSRGVADAMVSEFRTVGTLEGVSNIT